MQACCMGSLLVEVLYNVGVAAQNGHHCQPGKLFLCPVSCPDSPERYSKYEVYS